MFSKIDQYLRRSINLDEEEINLFHSVLKLKNIKKKAFLLQKGEVCNFEAYILKGCLKSYYLDENGAEIILMFAVEDWWISDIASFTDQMPATTFIEALEDTELILIMHKDKEMLYERIPKLERMFRMMFQRSYVLLQNRFFATIAKPAEERYLDFLKRYPLIPQRVPQHQIAAYLGISPEFLSKIRARMRH